MSGLFIAVLNMSLTASYVVLAVMVIRYVLQRARLPFVFSYALWSVVLLRLVVPFSFESTASLIPGQGAAIPHNIATSDNPAIQTGIALIDSRVNQSLQTVPPAPMADYVHPLGVVLEIGAAVWAAGIALLLIYGLVSYIGLKRKLAFATRVRGHVYETDRIRTPFVFGFIKPNIYLPIGLTRQEQHFILMHEQTHIRRLDYMIKPAAFLILALHWFNPLVWISYFLMIKDMEMSCDEKVMMLSEGDARADYSRTLLALASRQSGLVSPLSFGESNVKSRVRNILNFKRPAVRGSVAAAVLLTALAILLLLNPAAKEAQEEGPFVVQGEAANFYTIYENHLIPFADMPAGVGIDTFILEVENMLFRVEPSAFEIYGGRMVAIEYERSAAEHYHEIDAISPEGEYTASGRQRAVYPVIAIAGDARTVFD